MPCAGSIYQKARRGQVKTHFFGAKSYQWMFDVGCWLLDVSLVNNFTPKTICQPFRPME
jgi:hypothetical protein